MIQVVFFDKQLNMLKLDFNGTEVLTTITEFADLVNRLTKVKVLEG